MLDPTLRDVIKQRFGVAVDRDSDGGQVLNSLKPRLPINNQALEGAGAERTLACTDDRAIVERLEALDVGAYQLRYALLTDTACCNYHCAAILQHPVEKCCHRYVSPPFVPGQTLSFVCD